MTRLELLKKEMKVVRDLHLMTFDDKERVLKNYQHEIDCIVLYNSPNPIYEED